MEYFFHLKRKIQIEQDSETHMKTNLWIAMPQNVRHKMIVYGYLIDLGLKNITGKELIKNHDKRQNIQFQVLMHEIFTN